MSEIKSNAIYTVKNPFIAQMTESRMLTKEGSAKDTQHYVIDISGSDFTYTCGDSLGVYPTNRIEEVDAVLKVLGLSGEEKVRMKNDPEDISLRDALFRRVALALPTKKFLLILSEKVSNSEEKKKLEDLLSEDSKEATKAYLVNREFIDLLEDYPSAKFDAQEFVNCLRRLVPRLYSIASSPSVYPNEVHLTVAVVRYETNEHERVGVASTYLSDRVEVFEKKTPVFIAKSKFGLPEDENVDLIMVGPGTGIAPFRAFLQERINRGSNGRTWLFFGDQHEATDNLYGAEFDEYLSKNQLNRIDNAWSRDQDYKIYVQNKMRENAADLWDWIKGGAFFYVCGDAERMAVDVDDALHDIIEKEGGMTEEDAKNYVKQMKKEKRYQRDVY